MNALDSSPYKKDWLATTGIARGLVSTAVGARVPTIQEYCEAFGCSRGVVQKALAALEENGAVALERRGKQGSFVAAKDEARLFEMSGLQYLTGSMPTPLNFHLAGLATGICQAMARCALPFTFAFVQGGQTRMAALERRVYDFVVVSRSTARAFIAAHPDIEEAFPLTGCAYSPPYALCVNQPGLAELQPGMRVAADPNSPDQWRLTQALCAGRGVQLVEMPYIPSIQAFFAGEVDAVVLREEGESAWPGQGFPPYERWRAHRQAASVIPINLEDIEDYQLPVVLVNRKNYGMAGIIRSYLTPELIAYIQKRVIDQQMPAQFY